jgi:hypothetical protein
MKITVFWDVAPCSLVETSVYFYEATRCNIPDDNNLLHLVMNVLGAFQAPSWRRTYKQGQVYLQYWSHKMKQEVYKDGSLIVF